MQICIFVCDSSKFAANLKIVWIVLIFNKKYLTPKYFTDYWLSLTIWPFLRLPPLNPPPVFPPPQAHFISPPFTFPFTPFQVLKSCFCFPIFLTSLSCPPPTTQPVSTPFHIPFLLLSPSFFLPSSPWLPHPTFYRPITSWKFLFYHQ